MKVHQRKRWLLQYIFLIHCLLFSRLPAFSQEATLMGRLVDAKTNEAILGANIWVVGSTLGTASDLSGNFQLSLPPGTYSLSITAIGYKDYLIESLTIPANELVNADIRLHEDAIQLAEVVVEAKGDLSNRNMLLLARRRASTAVEQIGAQELSEKGISNVAIGLSRVPGIAQTSRGIFVRGLGDRYNNVYLNSLPLPSANPDRKVLELDILPTTVVRNISVSKVYTVDQFGDISGASIDVFSKDPVQEDFVSFEAGVGYNSRATGNEFILNRDLASNYLGIAGQRKQAPFPVDGTDFVARFPQTEQAPFFSGFDPDHFRAPLDQSWSAQFGKSIKKSNNSWGLIFGTSYKNRYRQDRGTNSVLDAVQVPTTNFLRQRYSFETNLSSLLGLSFERDKRHRINLNYLLVNNGDNQFIVSQGSTIDFENLRRLRSRFLQKRLSALQVTAKHEIVPNRLDIQWGGSSSWAFGGEPDRRDLTFFSTPDSDRGAINRNIAAENGRFFQEITERESSFFSEVAIHLGNSSLHIGHQFRDKSRATDFRTFTLATGGLDTEDIELSALDALFSDDNFRNGNFSYRDINGGERQARVLRTIHGFYTFSKWQLLENLQIVPGIRLELTDQQVFFKLLGTPLESPFRVAEFTSLDVLPSLNLAYYITTKQLVRVGASQTLTRPNFNELIPAPQVNENLQSVVGRPSLGNSQVTNLDLRFESFPTAGELLSFGVFYKFIDRPIEQVRSGENFISFFQVDKAHVLGLEVESRKNLNSLIDGLFLEGNVSLLYSRVGTDPNDIEDLETRALLANVTRTNRPLQGSSPWLLNISAGYDGGVLPAISSSVRLTYHAFGRRIFNVGTQQRGDEYELSYPSLDLIWHNRFDSGFGFGLKFQNLLNPQVRREQEAGPLASFDRVTQGFRTGINLGLTVSWRFNED